MKKIFTKIAVCVMAFLMVIGAVGCKKPEWAGTNMKNWGAISAASADGGFIAETENYYYFINGIADNTDDNTFGAPVKGALVAVDKNNLSKAEVVVPKLFAAADYTAGVYIFGDETNGYVYYGTPSTDKNNAGNVANDELTFMRTKLDGSATDEFFTVDSLTVNYRFVEEGDKVYLLYYDDASTALKCYDTASGSTTVIAKTDDKTNDKMDGEYQTLANYTFTDAGEIVFTTTVFTTEYFEANPSARGKAAYNRVYKYKAGDTVNGAFAGTLIKDGKGANETENKTYAIKLATEDYIFYTETDYVSNATTYAVSASAADWTVVDEIKLTDLVAETTLFNSINEVYYVKDGTVYKADLTVKNSAQPVAKLKNASQLLFVEDGNVYFLDANSVVSRIKLNDAEADEVVVTDVAIVTTWYKYEVITDGAGDKYFVYCDGTDVSATYLRYVKLTDTYEKKDKDDDGEDDYFYLDGNEVFGKMLPEHAAAAVTDVINEIGTANLDYEKEDGGNIKAEAVEKARAAYDKLSSAEKELIESATLKKLTNAEKAVDVIKVLVKLEGIRNHGVLSADQLTELENVYKNEAKPLINGLGDNAKAVRALVSNNLNWCYQKAAELFEAE